MKTWHFLLKKIQQQNQAVILLYVLDNQGSSPGRKGFKMALAKDGEFEGTIGGGIMEVKLLELARQRLQKRETEILIKKQFHDKKHAKNQSGMICSGEQTVALIPLQYEHIEVLQNIIEGSRKDIKIKLNREGISLTNKNEEERLVELEDAERFEAVFSLTPPKRVHIFGGGHVGSALSQALSLLDYYILVYDDRPDLNTLQQNHFADEIHIVDYGEVKEKVGFEASDSVVIVTFSYRTDKLLLQQLHNQSFAYIGMMGSDAKIKTLYNELQKEGISNKQLAHVAAPIGVPIYSKTAMEIAFSIAGQMINERNKYLPTGRTYPSEFNNTSITKNMKKFRDNGAIGALLDEYEKSIQELQEVISDVTPEELVKIVDSETKDPDCKSIQTILTHVVGSGYGYAVYIRNSLGEQIKPYRRKTLHTPEAYQESLNAMFQYNVQMFEDYPNVKLNEKDNSKKILVRWGQLFDVEQLIEHAIVHILRHRRQIERFLIKLRK